MPREGKLKNSILPSNPKTPAIPGVSAQASTQGSTTPLASFKSTTAIEDKKEVVNSIKKLPPNSSSYSFKLEVVRKQRANGKDFSIQELDKENKLSNMAVLFELAPARKSFLDKQGQSIPGADGGLNHSLENSIVKFNVPGESPIYQRFGIASEELDWVGAFVGYEEDGRYTLLKDRKSNALAEALVINRLFRIGRLVALTLNVNDVNIAVNSRLGSIEKYVGFIKNLELIYASDQKVYYRICIEVVNRSVITEGFTKEQVEKYRQDYEVEVTTILEQLTTDKTPNINGTTTSSNPITDAVNQTINTEETKTKINYAPH